MTILRSAVFMLWFVFVSVLFNVGFLWALALPRKVTVFASRGWSRWTLWGLKVFAGLDYELRGQKPTGPVLIAAKHMSMWDTIALYLILHDPAVVLKRELLGIPFYGWYARKARMIAIDRNAGARALRKMASAARRVIAEGRSVVIFPEGTRKKPGAAPGYKPGVAGLYGQLDVPCVPVALNSGLFWTGPGGFLKKRGRIIVEFLKPIPPGLKRAEFMATLEQRIEQATDRLLKEGRALLKSEGFTPV